MDKLINKDYGTYKFDKISYDKFVCIDDKKKKYEKHVTNELPINIKNLSYINIYHNLSPNIIVTTPIMVVPFGFETNNGFSLKLQFTNYKSDNEMLGFYNFIKNIEFINMKYLGITDDTDMYRSQIYHTDKYDPLLVVKVPFLKNRFNVEVYHEKYNLNVSNIHKFSKVKCDIYIDKIWKYNDKYICKWKLNKIYIY